MIWSPVIRVGDLVVRAMDGSRYIVTDRKETSARGVRLHQEFDLKQVPKTDILMEVTDEGIARALDTAEMPGFLRSGFRIFG